MELVFLLVSAWGLRSGGLSVKPCGLEHPLGCAHWRRPSGCKRQLRRSGSLAWMRHFADVSCLCLRVCERCLQVRDWAKAVLPRSPQVAETLHEQEVDGEDVLDLTYQRRVAEPYTIAAGPAGTGQAHRCCVCPADSRKRIPGGGLSGLEGCLGVSRGSS